MDDLGSPTQPTRKTPLKIIVLERNVKQWEQRLKDANNQKARIDAQRQLD